MMTDRTLFSRQKKLDNRVRERRFPAGNATKPMDRRTPVSGSGMMTGVKVSETYPEAVAPEGEAALEDLRNDYYGRTNRGMREE